MIELKEIVPRSWPVAKEPRCAEGPCVKTMLSAGAIRTVRSLYVAQRRVRLGKGTDPGVHLSSAHYCDERICRQAAESNHQAWHQHNAPRRAKSSPTRVHGALRIRLRSGPERSAASQSRCDLDQLAVVQRPFLKSRADNGRFLRHRPERSERCLNYGNCTKASPRDQPRKVCRRPQRKNHVVRPSAPGDNTRVAVTFRKRLGK